MGLVLILLAVIGLAAALTAQYFAAKAAVGFCTDLKHDLFAHIQRLSFEKLDQMRSEMYKNVSAYPSGQHLSVCVQQLHGTYLYHYSQ